MLAVISRVALVLSIGWVMSLKAELFSSLGHAFTGRDIILVLGGLFLVFKATREIHHKVQSAGNDDNTPVAEASLKSVLIQVMLIDVVFSLDSVITAVGMTSGLKSAIPIMVIAIIASVLGMLVFSKAIVTFIERNPAIKVLALVISDADRNAVDRRRIRQRNPQRIRLLRNGVFVLCRTPANVDRKEKPSFSTGIAVLTDAPFVAL